MLRGIEWHYSFVMQFGFWTWLAVVVIVGRKSPWVSVIILDLHNSGLGPNGTKHAII